MHRLLPSSRRADTTLSSSEPSQSELAETIARARAGGSAALAELYAWYAPDLLRLLTRLLASRAQAEDIVHDLFVGLPEHLARYQERGTFRAWLRATGIGMARMAARRELRRTRVLSSAATTAPSFGTHDPGVTLDVERAVGRLPEPLRQVFVLKQWEGYSHEEIALLLDISPGASRVRHSRALDTLRSFLDH